MRRFILLSYGGGGVEGWVDLGSWLHMRRFICPPIEPLRPDVRYDICVDQG